jgi:transposase
MAPGYYQALRERVPQAALCIDPFHVIKLANRALERFRRTQWRLHSGRRQTARERWLTGTRWALLTGAEHHSEPQRQMLAELERANHDLYRAYLLKEQLRALYQLPDPAQAPRSWTLGCRRPEPADCATSNSWQEHSSASGTGSSPRSGSASPMAGSRV